MVIERSIAGWVTEKHNSNTTPREQAAHSNIDTEAFKLQTKSRTYIGPMALTKKTTSHYKRHGGKVTHLHLERERKSQRERAAGQGGGVMK